MFWYVQVKAAFYPAFGLAIFFPNFTPREEVK